MHQCKALNCYRVTLRQDPDWLWLGSKAFCPACKGKALDRLEADIVRAGDWRSEPEEPGEDGFQDFAAMSR